MTHKETSLVGEKARELHSQPWGMPEAVGQNRLEIRVQWVTWSGLSLQDWKPSMSSLLSLPLDSRLSVVSEEKGSSELLVPHT